jgi:S1-C subfamily serine protease
VDGGLPARDIVYSVNRKRVQTAAELQNALRGAQSYAVGLIRGDFNLTILLR